MFINNFQYKVFLDPTFKITDNWFFVVFVPNQRIFHFLSLE